MELLPLAFASGFSSGFNAYATVFILGLAGRFWHTGGIPAGFARTDVLIVMGVLGLLELVADKIPYLDSVWDGISTFIRPIAGAVIGALMGGAQGNLATITLAAVGGVTALLTHLSKSSIRLAINTSPEPVTNVSHSVANDVTAASVISLAALNPTLAAILAGILLLAMMALAFLLLRLVKKGLARVRAWRARAATGPRS